MPIPNDETCRHTDLYLQHWTELQPIIHLPMICVMMPPSNLLQSQLHMCLYVAKAQEVHLGYCDLL